MSNYQSTKITAMFFLFQLHEVDLENDQHCCFLFIAQLTILELSMEHSRTFWDKFTKSLDFLIDKIHIFCVCADSFSL